MTYSTQRRFLTLSRREGERISIHNTNRKVASITPEYIDSQSVLLNVNGLLAVMLKSDPADVYLDANGRIIKQEESAVIHITLDGSNPNQSGSNKARISISAPRSQYPIFRDELLQGVPAR